MARDDEGEGDGEADTVTAAGDGDADPDDGDPLAALADALALKEETRTGWALRGVADPESVAAHSWGVALLTLAFADRAAAEARERGVAFDRDRALRIAVVHDLAEAEVGDLPTRADPDAETYDPAEKERRERAAMASLAGPLPDSVRDDWEAYEAREGFTARYVKDVDLLEMCLQALVYERGDRYDPEAGDPDAFREYDALDEFFATAEPRLSTDLGRDLFAEIRERYEAARDDGEAGGGGDGGDAEPGGDDP